MTFQHELNAKVTLTTSDEEGVVIGRSDYLASESQYLVRYKAADGRATDAWWPESALTATR